MKVIYILLIILLLSYCSSILYSDIIYLKNGGVLEGEIIEEADDYLKIKVKIGEIKVERDNVESVERKDLPEDYYSEDIKTIPSEQTESETMVVEKEIEDFEYELGVEAICLNKEKGYIVEVSGETNLPEDSLLSVFLKRLDKHIAIRRTRVQDGRYFIEIGPLNGKLPFGKYIIRVMMILSKQTEEVKEEVRLEEARFIDNTYKLLIGHENEIEAFELETIAVIKNNVDSLETLFNDLNNYYMENKINNDLELWELWQSKWSDELNKLKEELETKQEKYIISLFPGVNKSMRGIIKNLFNLNNLYIRILKDPEGYKKECVGARVTPAVLKDEISGNILWIRQFVKEREQEIRKKQRERLHAIEDKEKEEKEEE